MGNYKQETAAIKWEAGPRVMASVVSDQFGCPVQVVPSVGCVCLKEETQQ